MTCPCGLLFGDRGHKVVVGDCGRQHAYISQVLILFVTCKCVVHFDVFCNVFDVFTRNIEFPSFGRVDSAYEHLYIYIFEIIDMHCLLFEVRLYGNEEMSTLCQGRFSS